MSAGEKVGAPIRVDRAPHRRKAKGPIVGPTGDKRATTAQIGAAIAFGERAGAPMSGAAAGPAARLGLRTTGLRGAHERAHEPAVHRLGQAVAVETGTGEKRLRILGA